MANLRALCKGVNLIKQNKHVTTLQLDRPRTMNAMTQAMYENLRDQIIKETNDKNTTFIVLEGANKNYSTGNDLSNFTKGGFLDPEEIQKATVEAAKMCQSFVQAFIDSEKPIIAKVDGNCFGIMCTTLTLCDWVYCTESANFVTPFTKIAQSPEGCSSLRYPEIFGENLCKEFLLKNKPLDPQTALKHGFVNQVFKDKAEMDLKVDQEIESMLKLPRRSFLSSRNLVRGHKRAVLSEVNRVECELLIERFADLEELGPVLAGFFSKGKK